MHALNVPNSEFMVRNLENYCLWFAILLQVFELDLCLPEKVICMDLYYDALSSDPFKQI